MMERAAMGEIYISNDGDDKNNGLKSETPVQSWKRAVKLAGGDGEMHLIEGDATMQRLIKEINGVERVYGE
jgi:hypothetical protein